MKNNMCESNSNICEESKFLIQNIDKNKFFESGIVQRNESIVIEKNNKHSVRHEDSMTVVEKNDEYIVKNKNIAVYKRNLKVSKNKINILSDLWFGEFSNIIKSTLEGIFKLDEIKKDFINDQSENVLNADFMDNSLKILGFDKTVGIACHSDVVRKLIDFEKFVSCSDPFYAEKCIIVDDAFVADTNRAYPIYFFDKGAFIYNEDFDLCKIESDYNKILGIDFVFSHRVFVLHPEGFHWKKSNNCESFSPSNDELTDFSNWEYASGKTDVKIALLKAQIE